MVAYSGFRGRLATWICRLTVFWFALLTAALSASAQKRVAFVVGNSAYTHAPRLANPENDAADMTVALRGLGFTVIPGINLSKVEFESALREFGKVAVGAETAFFFYAGHGLQAKGVNYLIPIDADVQSEQDLDFTAISLDLALKQVRQAETKIIMLDACRNNPFAGSLSRSMGTRAVGENLGLAVTVASDLGTFIAYATQPGNVASDGTGRNSPFTDRLKAHLAAPGQSISDLMMVVRNEVAAVTGGMQIPWEHSALSRKFYFKAGAAAAVDDAGQKASEAAEAWSWVRNSANSALFDEFIRRYGDTPFAGQARSALSALKGKSEATAMVLPNMATLSMRQVKPSFDCRAQYKESEVTICNNAELSILDNELSRLYSAALQGIPDEMRSKLAADQRRWLVTRDDCRVDIGCLTRAHQTRITNLAKAARSLTKVAAKAKPSFDCATHALPAEVAICSDTNLAFLDVELDEIYVKAAGRIGTERRRALLGEQQRWLVLRDTCANDRSCLALQYRARISQLRSLN